MLIVVFKIDPPLCKRTRCCRSLLSTLFIFVLMQIVVFVHCCRRCSSLLSCRLLYLKLHPRRCTSSFNVVVIVRWLPAELTTEGLMLIVVFLNCSPLPSIGRCRRCLMSSFTFDVKGLDGRQRPTHDQWTNADCCILIFPPFPSLVVGRLMLSFSIDVRFCSTSLFPIDVVVRRD